MRRSAAPSQVHQAKRPRFMVPFKTPSSTVSQVPVLNPVAVDLQAKSVPESQNRLSSESIEVAASAEKSSGTPVPRTTTFRSPLQKINGSLPETRLNIADNKPIFKDSQACSPVSQTGDVVRRYLSVMWCKLSKKKHKKWEGDAVLVTGGRSVSLYDMEGKEIGKGTGYKSAELQTLKEDESLVVGGKEIQVMSVLTEEQYKSGKCFVGANTAASVQPVKSSASVNIRTPEASKPFVNPQKGSGFEGKNPVNIVKAPATPRYDPNRPDALVMPRPSSSHQWLYNRRELPVVDVVVDPVVSSLLRPHQREGVVFLYECVMGFRDYTGQGAILADDMGLGKTLQCIAMIWTLFKQGPYGGKPVIKRTLVITPGSLVKNWFQEIKKWLGSERLSAYAVTSDQRVEDYMNATIYPVLIISYEMFVRAYETVKQATFDLVICDEGHRLKNTAIKTTSLIMSLPTQRRVVLTGTPIQNDLQEFYSLVDFCNPGVLGSSAAFHRVYEDPIVLARQPSATPTEVELGEERAAELTRLTKMFILRRTQEINNKYLPPKCELVLFCRPSPLQLALYRHLLSCRQIRSCLAGKLDGAPHLICIAALKQLCNHPSLIYSKSEEVGLSGTVDDTSQDSIYRGLSELYPPDYNVMNSLASQSGKLTVLSCLLQELHTLSPMEKIVLVSNHTKTLDILQQLCTEFNYKYLRLDGQTPTVRRQELVQRFNCHHGNDFVFLLSSKAGGVGLNLTGASRLVLYDIDWNPANDLQAMARVWRDGQQKKVHIYRLLTTGSIEEKVYQRQISKQGLSGAVMDVNLSKNQVQFSKEDLRDLFSLSDQTDCDTHDLLGCDCDFGGGGGGGGGGKTCPPSPPVSRSCQLGPSKLCDSGDTVTKSQRNLGMAELLDWQHWGKSAADRFPEWFLHSSQDHISCLFSCETAGGS